MWPGLAPLCLLALVAGERFASSLSVAECPKDLPFSTAMKVHGNSCYQFVSQEKYWFQARDYCHQNQGRLAKVGSADVNDFIVKTLNELWWRNNGVWIGLHDVYREMRFTWTGYKLYDDDPVGWTNWARGHPGAFLHSIRDCVRMVRDGGSWKWHETLCNALKWHYRFICEYKVTWRETDAVGSALSQRSPVPIRSNASSEVPSPTTVDTSSVEVTTAEDSPESTAMQSNEEGAEMLLTQDERSITLAVMEAESGVKEMIQELQDYYISEKLSDYDEATTEDAALISSKGFPLIAVLCCVIPCLLLALILLLRKRRASRKTLNEDDPKDVVFVADGKQTTESAVKVRTTCAISNIYSDIADQRKASGRPESDGDGFASTADANGDPFLEESTGRDLMTSESSTATASNGLETTGSGTQDCGMMGYDMPRPTNVYDEIPEGGDFPAAGEEHLYESLDEVMQQV